MIGKRGVLAIIVVVAAYYYYQINTKKHLPSPVVETASGKVQGIESLSRQGKVFYEYLGLPYALAPLNELRYESPLPPKSWTGIREAKKYGNECAQLNLLAGNVVGGHEDCLFVNVFTTKPNSNAKLPVMVFLHGGIFHFGSGNMYRPDFFVDEDVVYVSMNYRLAGLGFLNTGDGIVKGNMGLKDQTMALRWVQQNIENFGGDKDRVTIFGESAGGASVHFQLLSSMSEGMYYRAISQSGVALNPWAIKTNVAEQAKRYAKHLNCPTDNTVEMVKCLKEKPINEILEGHRESTLPLRDPISFFSPSIELPSKDAFITEHPWDIIKSGKASKVPYITGQNSHEGLLSSPVIVRDEEMLKKFNEEFNDVMPNFMFYQSVKGDEKGEMSKIRDFYFGKGERIDTMEKMENYTNLFTDYVWGIGIQEVIQLQSQFSPVYPYYYTYKGQFTLSNIILAMKGKYPPILELSWYFIKKWVNAKFFGIHVPHYGPCHGDEMALEFPLTGLADVRQGHPDYELSLKLVKLWTAFAKNEIPLETMGTKWLPVNAKSEVQYLKFDTSPEIMSPPNQDRMNFWKKLNA